MLQHQQYQSETEKLAAAAQFEMNRLQQEQVRRHQGLLVQQQQRLQQLQVSL
jgi:hypothetical protein